MKHLNYYIDFRINENWLGDKLANSSEGIKLLLSDFTKNFKEIDKKIKIDWQEEFTADNVKKELLNLITKSFETMIKSIDKTELKEDLQTIFDEIDQTIVQFNDQLIKEIDNISVKESIKSYKDFLQLNEAQESVMSGLQAAINSIFQEVKNSLEKNREDYLKIFEQEEDKEPKALDTLRVEVKDFFNKISKEIESDIKSLNVKSIIADAKAKVETENSANQEEYQAGTILKYTKKDGEENTAEVANNQENVETGFINMISQDGKEKFIINQDKIIGVADEEGNVEVTPEDITNSLEDIKGDNKKMNKLKDFIEKELI